MISKPAEMNLSYDHYDTTNQRFCWQARFKLKQDSIQATEVLSTTTETCHFNNVTFQA